MFTTHTICKVPTTTTTTTTIFKSNIIYTKLLRSGV